MCRIQRVNEVWRRRIQHLYETPFRRRAVRNFVPASHAAAEVKVIVERLMIHVDERKAAWAYPLQELVIVIAMTCEGANIIHNPCGAGQNIPARRSHCLR